MTSQARKQHVSDVVSRLLPPKFKLLERLELSRLVTMDNSKEVVELMNRFARIRDRVLTVTNFQNPNVDTSKNLSACFLKLGSKDFFNVVIRTCLGMVMENPREGMALWSHMDHCSRFSEGVSERLAPEVKDDSYIVSCFHDFGLILCQLSLDHYHYFLKEALSYDPDITQFEEEAFGVSHNEISAELMLRWGFSERLSELVRMHHHDHFDMIQDSVDQKVLCVHHIAEYLCQRTHPHLFIDIPHRDISELVCTSSKVLGTSNSEVCQALEEVMELYSESQRLAS